MVWLSGCDRWLVKAQTVDVPRQQFVAIPPTLTAATDTPAMPTLRCTAKDGKPTLCADQLEEWITFGWAPALRSANRDKLLIRCLQAAAVAGDVPAECKQ